MGKMLRRTLFVLFSLVLLTPMFSSLTNGNDWMKQRVHAEGETPTLVDGKWYVNGELANGVYNVVYHDYYQDVCQAVFYVNGEKGTGFSNDGTYFVDGALAFGLYTVTVWNNQLASYVTEKDCLFFKGRRYNGALFGYYYVQGKKVDGFISFENGQKKYFVSGLYLTGWQTMANKKYYFASTSGYMRTGWQTISQKRYYFDANGVMRTGWQTINGKRYYFGSNGVMRTKWQTVAGKRYNFGSNGVVRTNWQKIGGKKYYFGSNGMMRTKWQKISGKYYYFGKKGVMVKNKTLKIGKKRFKFDKKGICRNYKR